MEAGEANSASAVEITSARAWRWYWGMLWVLAVALIWIAARFVVQSVEGKGVTPFLITYVCNSLFIVYIPIVEGGRYLERAVERRGWRKLGFETTAQGRDGGSPAAQEADSEGPNDVELSEDEGGHGDREKGVSQTGSDESLPMTVIQKEEEEEEEGGVVAEKPVERPWSTKQTALVGLTICPFWFLAQFCFNLSLEYTTVTSNTILSTTTSLFMFLASVRYLGERFTWIKLASVGLCMAGTVVVSLGDSWKGQSDSARRPFLGDVICLLSAIFYTIYTALLRVKIPDEDDEKGRVSTALIFGYLGLFNALLLAPVAVLLHVTGVEPVYRLTSSEIGLVVSKGLLDNVLSDYLWARAVLLTSPTAATAGLTIQVPIAAVIDSIRGVIPSFMDIIGGIAVLIGFFGINKVDVAQPPPTEERFEKEAFLDT